MAANRRGGDDDTYASFEARIDPDGEHRRLATGMALLTAGPSGWLMERLGIERDTIDNARAAPDRFAQLVNGLEAVARTLARHGWIAFGAIPSDAYQQAAQLARNGDVEAAESLLVETWEERLDMALHPLLYLYEDQDRRPIGHARMVLMREALDNYRDGRYASAITLTISQIDGIVYDMTGSDAKSFFASGRKASHLTDQQTIPGHPAGLAVLGALFTKDRKHTSLEGDLRRHAIVHGRELAYGTKTNAIKTFVALSAVIEWARPTAAAETQRLQSEREQRYAGSDELDEWGRRLDRRGFDRVQRALEKIELYQHGRFSRAGYAADVRQLEMNNEFWSIPGIELQVSADGQSFRAWAPTDGGITFGVAGREGEQIGWRYQGQNPPPTDVLVGNAWRHLLKDEPHPDW
jgi:hypothetical protein